MNSNSIYDNLDGHITIFDRSSLERRPLKLSQENAYVSKSVFKINSFRIIIACLLAFTILITFALIISGLGPSHLFLEFYPHGSVMSEVDDCSLMGTNALKYGGSAVDAVIATYLCLGVRLPHIAGIGGEGVMIIYNHRSMQATALDFMSVVPTDIHDSILSFNKDMPVEAIPGVLKCFEKAHKKYGKISWLDVVLPVAQLAGRGFPMTAKLFEALKNFQNLENVFVSNGSRIGINETVRWDELARTLETIARNGSEDFYSGKLASGLPFTEKDLGSYSCDEYIPESVFVNGKKILVPSVSGGKELIDSLEFLNRANMSMNDDAHLYSSIIQAMQNSRMHSNVNQLRIAGGTTVLAVDNEELFVALVSGLGGEFGSGKVADGSIILNDGIHDFLFQKNQTSSRKYASRYLPMIILEENNKCGLRGTFASVDNEMAFQVLGHTIYNFSHPIEMAVNMPRLLLADNQVFIEGHDPSYQDLVLNFSNMAKPSNELRCSGVDSLLKIKNSLYKLGDYRNES